MKRPLADFEPDELISELEARQDKWISKQEVADAEEARHDAYIAARYTELKRCNGLSIEDAKAAVRADADALESQEQARAARFDAMRAKMAVERARLAIDAWRTIQANKRMV